MQSSGRRPRQLPWQLRHRPPLRPQPLQLQEGLLRGYRPCCPVLLMMQLILALPGHIAGDLSAVPLPSGVCRGVPGLPGFAVSLERKHDSRMGGASRACALGGCTVASGYPGMTQVWVLPGSLEGHLRGTLLRRR